MITYHLFPLEKNAQFAQIKGPRQKESIECCVLQRQLKSLAFLAYNWKGFAIRKSAGTETQVPAHPAHCWISVSHGVDTALETLVNGLFQVIPSRWGSCSKSPGCSVQVTYRRLQNELKMAGIGYFRLNSMHEWWHSHNLPGICSTKIHHHLPISDNALMPSW